MGDLAPLGSYAGAPGRALTPAALVVRGRTARRHVHLPEVLGWHLATVAPSLSVIVCTRDRGLQLVDTVQSILACPAGDFELLVVDQSSGGGTAAALSGIADRRLRYIPTDTRGLSRARNIGVRRARGAIVAMTDDDCTVDPAFIDGIRRAFARDDRIGLVFGNVVAAPHDRSQGFIPGYERTGPFLADSLADKAEVEGMGACMAFRRQWVLDLGGFDERFGAGSPLRAGEDVDITLRALCAGLSVYETPDISVTHHRFQRWAEGPALARAYWLGAGAAIGKHTSRHPWHGVRLLCRLSLRFLLGPSRVARSFASGDAPAARLLAFARGFVIGVRGVRSGAPEPASASGHQAKDAAAGS